MQAADRDIWSVLDSALTIPVYVGRAPRTAALPYAVLQPSASNGYRTHSSRTRVEDRAVTVHVWHTSADAARGFLDSAETALTGIASTLSIGSKLLNALKVFDNLELDPDSGPDDGEIWHGTVSVNLAINRQPT